MTRHTIGLMSCLFTLLLALGCGGGEGESGGGGDKDSVSGIDWVGPPKDTGWQPELPPAEVSDEDTGATPDDAVDGGGDGAPQDLGPVDTGPACPGDDGCHELDDRECMDGAKYRICRETDDGCLAWKGPLSCGLDKSCIDGACVCEFEACGIGCCGDGQVCHNGFCCSPACAGKECGPDGCGGVCGECEGETACDNGLCSCTPDCASKTCGGDGCGGSCGDCPEDYSCWDDNQCHLGGCVPQCAGKVCGDDGCGSFCGVCYGCGGQPLPPEDCVGGQCPEVCCPDCLGKTCGADGCGGLCGVCAVNETCEENQCVCIPACQDKECGDDGCGDSCGTCYGCMGIELSPDLCQDGQCPPVCCPNCGGAECGPDGCGGVCGECLGCDGEPLPVAECQGGACPVLCCPACTGKECGPDGCGGVCGEHAGECPNPQDECVDGHCGCVPACAGKECGPDGCGGFCGDQNGACPDGALCLDGQCECQPQCAGLECGDDGCGGECGPCPGDHDVCTAGTCVCQPSCIGRECGSDGCIGSCGQCASELFECSGEGQCVPLCGNTVCDEVESCEICADDCGVCSYVPDYVYMIDGTGLSDAEMVLLMTLQGVVAKKKPEIYITGALSSAWMTDLLSTYQVDVELVNDLWTLVGTFTSKLVGYVLYDPGTDSESCATTLAGLYNAVAISPGLETKAQEQGLALYLDARGKDEAWCRTHHGANVAPGLAVELSELGDGHRFLRDWAVQQSAFVYGEEDAAFRLSLMGDLDAHAPIYGGVSEDEEGWLMALSAAGHPPVRAARAANLSLLSKMTPGLFGQRNHLQESPVTEDGVHYVAFVMGGGDRIDFTLNDLLKSGWWGNSHRGEYSMNWELSPRLAELAPTVARYLFDKATTGATQDYFVAAASGPGSVLLADHPDVSAWAAQVDQWSARSDLGVVSVVSSGGALGTADPLLSQERVMGVLFRDYAIPELYAGEVRWYLGKPTLSYRFHLTDDENALHTPEVIAEALNAQPRQPRNDPNSYSLVYVDPDATWDTGADSAICMNMLTLLVQSLDDGVRIVSAEALLYHMRRHFGLPLEVPDDARVVSHDLPSQLAPGEVREVHLTVENTGTNVWKNESGYALGALEDSALLAPAAIELPEDLTVSPGYTYTFTFELTAPETPGTYLTSWRMVREQVSSFGEEVFAAIGVGGPPTWTYEAEADLWHDQGKVEGDGWACQVLLHTADYMCDGPDETRIPGGFHQATFRVMTENVTGDWNPEGVAYLDVYDADTDTSLAEKRLFRSNFPLANTYQDFVLGFTSQTGHRLQFRVFYTDQEYVKVDKITVQ